MQLGPISESNHSATNSKTYVTTAESISLYCSVLDLTSSFVLGNILSKSWLCQP